MCHEPKYFMDSDRYIFRFTKDILLLFYIAFTLFEIHRLRIRSQFSIMAETDRRKETFRCNLMVNHSIDWLTDKYKILCVHK
jgi:hypothetical protein